MCGNIDSFEICGLYGYLNFKIQIHDNTLILIGENGSSKTTVLRLLYYILSGQWNGLMQYNFHELKIRINGNLFCLQRSLLDKFIRRIDNKYLKRIPSSIRYRLYTILNNKHEHFFNEELEFISGRYRIPLPILIRELDSFENYSGKKNEVESVFNDISNAFDSKILYLPTYRRIEKELSSIYKSINESEWDKEQRFMNEQNRECSYIELIEFGMKDVDMEISQMRERLKEFARESLNKLTLDYLGDVVDQKYTDVKIEEIQGTSDSDIKDILDRIQENILPTSVKEHLFEKVKQVKEGGNLNEYSKVISHYFLKLLNFQKELRSKERQMAKFCHICNQYMGEEKTFTYDSARFEFFIKLNKQDNRTVELKDLSSGEKQIVSLFSHIYLSATGNSFVLIDEPELSLSVVWQKRFLRDIKNCETCSGLVAVTHSPFIYQNSLDKYAHGINEFISEGN